MKILIAGLGSAGQRHARNLRTLLGGELELLAYRVRRRSPVIRPEGTVSEGAIEDAYGIRSFDDLDEALAERPDAVFVANPNVFHIPVALAAARAGCHLFVEKPLSHDLDGIDELARLVDDRRLVCAVGYQLRFHPAYAVLHELDLGRVVSARFEAGEYLPDMHPWEDYRALNYARRDQGGGVILMQSHELDMAYALFGLPRKVVAVGGKLSGLEIDAEDTAGILLDYAGLAVDVQLDFLRRPPLRRYELVGEKATAVWDHADDFVTHGGGLSSWPEQDRNGLFLDELAHFLDCIEGRAHPVVDVRAAADVLRVALAARRSLETGAVVEL